jgi:hypothetical protein
MTVNEIQPADEPTGPHPSATDRAVAAVESMMDASSRVSNAYADAYQEAVMNMAGLRGKLSPADRLSLVPPPARAAGDPVRKTCDATTTVTRVSEQLMAASRQLSLAYADVARRMFS